MCDWSVPEDLDVGECGGIPFPNCTGVYQILAVTRRSKKPIPIKRLLGTDEEGILLIGCSTDEIRTRIRANIMNLKGYRGIQETIQRKIPHHLQARCQRLHCIRQIKAKEKRLLEEYRHKFGEYPPLNANGGSGR